MRTIQAAIVAFDKPFFIYNENGVKTYPTDVQPNSEAIDTLSPNDKYYVADTIEQVMVEFDKLGFVMPDADFWDHPQKEFRLNIPNDDIPKIILASPTVALKLEALKLWIVERNRSQLIYITSLDAEDKILEKYLQPRFENPII